MDSVKAEDASVGKKREREDDDDRPIKLKKEFMLPDHDEFKKELLFMVTHFFKGDGTGDDKVQERAYLETMAKLRADPTHVDKLLFVSGVHFAYGYMYLFMGKYEQFYCFLNEERTKQYHMHSKKIQSRLSSSDDKWALTCYETYAKVTTFVRRVEMGRHEVHILTNAIFFAMRMLFKLETAKEGLSCFGMELKEMKEYMQNKGLPVLMVRKNGIRQQFLCEIARYANDVVLSMGGKRERKATIMQLQKLARTCLSIEEKTVRTRIQKLQNRDLFSEKELLELRMNDLIEEDMGFMSDSSS